MTIDSHHHFWNYSDAEFGWISDDMSALRRDFGPGDLHAVMQASGITGSLSVQARQTIVETAWLLEQANAHDFLRGVVGWLPLAAPDVRSELERFASEPKLRGLRHIVQGEAPGFLEGAAFNEGVALLPEFGLVYDVLIYERQLPEAIAFVDRHPQVTFVLDHIAKPRIEEGILEPWATNMRELARRDNVFCKLSGMVTEANFTAWTPTALKPYFDVVLEAFGPQRLMFGSDWPVCLAATSYENWVNVVREWTAPLSNDEQAAFWGGTAQRAYHLA